MYSVIQAKTSNSNFLSEYLTWDKSRVITINTSLREHPLGNLTQSLSSLHREIHSAGSNKILVWANKFLVDATKKSSRNWILCYIKHPYPVNKKFAHTQTRSLIQLNDFHRSSLSETKQFFFKNAELKFRGGISTS